MTNIDKLISMVCYQLGDQFQTDKLNLIKSVLVKSFKGYELIKLPGTEIMTSSVEPDAEILKEFLACKKLSGRANSSLKQYTREIWKFRGFIKKNFKEVKKHDIRQFLAYLQTESNNSMATITNKRRYLSSFFEWMKNEGYISSNPVMGIETFKVETRIRKAYTQKDIVALRNHCKDTRDRAIVEFLLGTGIRVSELTQLNLYDIDFESKEFYVIGKGNKERRCFIPDVAVTWLTKYINERKQQGECFTSDTPLFIKVKNSGCKNNRVRMTNDVIRLTLKRIAKNAGISNVYPHRFRRTFATDMLQKMNIEEVKELMGHKKIETTMIYVDLTKYDNIKRKFFS